MTETAGSISVHLSLCAPVLYLGSRILAIERRTPVEILEVEAFCTAPQMAYSGKLLAATPELPAGVA